MGKKGEMCTVEVLFMLMFTKHRLQLNLVSHLSSSRGFKKKRFGERVTPNESEVRRGKHVEEKCDAER